MIINGILSRAICDIVGYAFPIYASVEAVQSGDKSDHTQWVMFWAVNACFSIFEIIGDVLIAGVPLYYEAKIVFMVWLALPHFQGATQLYHNLLAPSFNKYEKQIDDSIEVVKLHASGKLEKIYNDTKDFAMRKSSGFLFAGQQYIIQQSVQNLIFASLSPRNGARQQSFLSDTPSSLETPDTVPNTPLEDDIAAPKVPECDAKVDSLYGSKDKSAPPAPSKIDLRRDTATTRHFVLESFEKLMVDGCRVKKYSQSSSEGKVRVLKLSSDCSAIKWESPSSSSSSSATSRSIALVDIMKIIRGNQTRGFQAADDIPPSEHCFCITTKTHRLELEVVDEVNDIGDSRDIRQVLIAGFRLLIAARRQEMKKGESRQGDAKDSSMEDREEKDERDVDYGTSGIRRRK